MYFANILVIRRELTVSGQVYNDAILQLSRMLVFM